MKKTPILLAVLVVCLIVLLFIRGSDKGTTTRSAPSSTANFSQWKILDDASLNYQALFPTAAKSRTNTSIDPRAKLPRVYKLSAAEALDTTFYLITEIQFPKDYNPSSDPTSLQTIVDELVANGPSNALKESATTVFNGDEALKFKIENDQKMVVMGLAFIHGQSIFILQRVSKEDKVDQKEFVYFINSFKFKKPA